ncbi:redoxin family protein [Actinospica robiniae]|uniref:redoxin family protein n=1 Tax=Actinospica robiniae TaxID=304901 RepID=UPI000423E611|nr:redoxin family protein [Actinospica robiniae]
MTRDVHMPRLDGATQWLNSEPLDPADLRGNVVLVNFWTLTCINWLRTQPHVRAWAQAYRAAGLVVVAVHTPEFSFEHDAGLVRQAAADRGIDYPIAVDNDYAVWDAFANSYWPALYFIDRNGVIRDEHFGEGSYEESEQTLQSLLGVSAAPAPVKALGIEADADRRNLKTPETYLGYARGGQSASPGDVAFDRRQTYELPKHRPGNSWALSGDWTVGSECVMPYGPDSVLAFRFHARDVNLVLNRTGAEPIPFQVLLDGEPPAGSHGVDVDEDGNGLLAGGRLYQLIRQDGKISERTVEIIFPEPGAEAYAFTFG